MALNWSKQCYKWDKVRWVQLICPHRVHKDRSLHLASSWYILKVTKLDQCKSFILFRLSITSSPEKTHVCSNFLILAEIHSTAYTAPLTFRWRWKFECNRLRLIPSSFLHHLFIVFVPFVATRAARSRTSSLSVSALIGLNKLPLLPINYMCSIFTTA